MPPLYHQQPCASYRYVLTPQGGKFVQLPDKESKDEESPADYNPGGYLPIHVGDTFKHGRYKVVRKLGWGHFSTVWLVKDTRMNRHSAMKVVKSATRYAETALDEIKLLSKISRSSPSHRGLKYIVAFFDSFTHLPSLPSQTPTRPLSTNPNQQGHICIVFEPLGENLLALITRHKHKGVSRALVKHITKQVLMGLEYLHDECDLVHTDIKPENILIRIPDIESHISSELDSCPTPTSRNVHVPLPSAPNSSSSYRHPGAMSIPTSRIVDGQDGASSGSSRRVQIWDSQPLGSPVFSSSPLIPPLTPLENKALPDSGKMATATAQVTQPNSPSTTISTSSSTSSLDLSEDAKLANSLTNTPSTSISLGMASASGGWGPNGLSAVVRNSLRTNSFEMNVKIKKAEEDSIQERLKSAMSSEIRRPTSASSSSSSSWETSFSSTPPQSTTLASAALKPPPSRAHRKYASDTPTQIKQPPSHKSVTKLLSTSMNLSILPRKLRLGLATPVPVPAAAVINLSNVKVDSDGTEGVCVLQPTPMTFGPHVMPIESEVKRTTRLPKAPASSTTTLPRIVTPPRTSPTTKWAPTRAPPPTPVDCTAPKDVLTEDIRLHGTMSASPCPRSLETRSTTTPTPSTPSNCTLPLPTPLPSTPSQEEELLSPIQIKIADLGNATPSNRHFTEEIQTRQYRAPEAIMGRRDWGCRVDVWSVACLVFELLTAEYLFDPQGQTSLFTKDDDHMAQIVELLGDFPLETKLGGRYSSELFDADGTLKYIKVLKPWPLKRVMEEKYGWTCQDAGELCAFLEPMLTVDWNERFSAKQAIACGEKGWLRVRKEDWCEA